MLQGDLGTLALGLVIAGAVSGLTAGMLGVGGGIVVVPVLYHVLRLMGIDPSVRMHLAVGPHWRRSSRPPSPRRARTTARAQSIGRS